MTATVPALLQPLKDRLAAVQPVAVIETRTLSTDQAKLIAAIEAVVALHEPGPGYLTTDVACQACSNSIGYVLYPCNTVRALTQALGGDTA